MATQHSARLISSILLALILCSCRVAVEEEADEKFAEAEAAFLAEEWEAADELFYETTLLDPERVNAWTGRGMTLTKLEEIEGARSQYEEALALVQKQLKEAKQTGNDSLKQIRRKEIMLFVLLNRTPEAEKIAENLPKSEKTEILALIKQLKIDFEDMILPEMPEETLPTVDGDQMPELRF